MTKFVIFTTPRTGSTLLIKSLDAHPEILCAGELFFFKGAIYHTEYKYSFWRLPFIGNKLNYVFNYPKLLLTLPGFLNNFFVHISGYFLRNIFSGYWGKSSNLHFFNYHRDHPVYSADVS